MAAKEKINLLEVIPCRSEHITAEREGETIVLSFPRFKYPWMQRFLVPAGMSKELHVRLEDVISSPVSRLVIEKSWIEGS